MRNSSGTHAKNILSFPDTSIYHGSENIMNTDPSPHPIASNIRAASAGLVLSILTILFGQGMGVLFGLNEDAIKTRLKTDAAEVQETVYKNDAVAAKAVVDKSWNYMQRAHLHAGGMGTTAVALIVILCLVGASRPATAIISAALGAGGLGYSVFWMWAGFRAPGLGNTGVAKESLKWLAMPSSGGFVLATVAVLVVTLAWILAGRGRGSRA